MLFSSQDWARKSRDTRFLFRASLAIVLVSATLALLLSLYFKDGQSLISGGNSKSYQQLLQAIVEEPESEEQWLKYLRTGTAGSFGGFPHDNRHLVDKTKWEQATPEQPEFPESLPAETREAFQLLHDGLHGGKLDEAIAKLSALPEERPYRNEILGDLYFVADEYAKARKAYLAASEGRPDSLYLRRSAVVTAWRELDRGEVLDLFRLPEFRDAFATAERLDIRADVHDFEGLFLDTAKLELEMLFYPSVIPALFTAGIWFAILMPFWSLSRSRFIAALVAFGLGVVSASLTLFAVMIQERVYGFVENPNDTPFAHFLYFVTGVALREETLKLLCFVPLAIWAARRRSLVEGMILPALVGLGFAFKENIVYLHSGLESYVAWVRFLTASVLHFSLTGIAGYYLYRMIQRKFHGWEEFLASFIAVVLAHGVYNSLISLPTLESYAVLSPVLVALMAYRFFDPLREVMDTAGIGRKISPLGVFVIGSALLTCLVLIASSIRQPYPQALGAFIASVAGMIPFSFAFISRFRDL